jgi:hypothetical protein
MAKTIIIRIKKVGRRPTSFNIYDDVGTLLGENVSTKDIINGVSYSVEDSVNVIVVKMFSGDCIIKTINLSIGTITKEELAAIKFQDVNTASIWTHLLNPTSYNKYYGCIHPYVIEYPFAYKFQDEILQNVKDYTKAYKYLVNDDGVFNDNRRIAINDYFNKAVLYNDQQSTGVLNLVAKPLNNLKGYLSYPIYNTDSKTILFTKSDNFYQYNTFWGLVKDKTAPLFTKSCESMSIDKLVNQFNMDYSKRSFKKETLRSKDLKVRHILDDKDDVHLVSQFIITPSQISYK